ncbi:MAG: hypothetical protein ACRDI2_05565 [Chloroflexota bacterium]
MLVGYVSDERYVALADAVLEFERDGESVAVVRSTRGAPSTPPAQSSGHPQCWWTNMYRASPATSWNGSWGRAKLHVILERDALGALGV